MLKETKNEKMKFICKKSKKLTKWNKRIIEQVTYANAFSSDTGGNIEIYCKDCYNNLNTPKEE